jgi:hypothetical protein
MGKLNMNLKTYSLSHEVQDLISTLSAESEDRFGKRLYQSQVIELAIRHLAEKRPKSRKEGMA